MFYKVFARLRGVFVSLMVKVFCFFTAGFCVLALASCSHVDPFGYGDLPPNALVVGSQDYYSNEILAEIYAQALEKSGYQIVRDHRIGLRVVYMEEFKRGHIDLFIEYTGNLLQYWDSDTTARTEGDVHSALLAAAPKEITVLDQAKATDQDTYIVTKQLAEKYDLKSIGDLKNLGRPCRLGGNYELEKRPYGPIGLKELYGVETQFFPVEDYGGPLTVSALQSKQIDVSVASSSSPTLGDYNLQTLEDPQHLLLASNVVPLVSGRVDQKARDVINLVSSKLSVEALTFLNRQSAMEQLPHYVIARNWLKENFTDELG